MDPAEQRANAVARLRRAASLPRMKDGRRPPMHGEGGSFSEGERSNSAGRKEEETGATTAPSERVESDPSGGGEGARENEPSISLGPATTSIPAPSALTSTETVPVAASTTTAPSQSDEKDKEETTKDDTEAQEASELERPVNSPSPVKRRSRSRSRSRGSKDLRMKMRQQEAAAASGNDLSMPGPDDANNTLVRTPTPGLDPASTTLPFATPQAQTAYLLQLQMAATASPLIAPLAPFYTHPASPSPAVSPALGVPSLQALQSRHLQGLFRPSSATARLTARNKLTGGTEPLDFSLNTSQQLNGTSPGRARLTRNNTVASEERVAARQQLLRCLNHGVETVSGAEDSGTPSKGKRRKSRHKSSSTIVDDRELAATLITITPSATPALNELHPPLIALPVSRSPSIPLEKQIQATEFHRTPTPSPSFINIATSTNPASNHYQYDSPLVRRGLVVEDEDEDDTIPTPPRTQQRASGPASPNPSTPVRSPVSQAVSLSSSSSERGSSADRHQVPVLLSGPIDSTHRSPFRQDVIPKSPFGTPIRERRRDEVLDEERVLFDGTPPEASDREPSWIAEPVPTLARTPRENNDDRENSWDSGAVPEILPGSIFERDVSWVEPSTLDKRMPVYDEDEDEDEEAEATGETTGEGEEEGETRGDTTTPSSRNPSDPASSRDSAESREILIDLRPSQEIISSDYSAPSQQGSTASTATAVTNVRESDISDVSATSARRGSPQLMDRSLSQADSMHESWGEFRNVEAQAPGLASKRSADSTGTSAWSKMKNTFTRSGSSLGRRSRTNSIAAREKKEAAASESNRESAASLASGRRESKSEAQPSVAWQIQAQAQTSSPSPSASVPILLVPPRSGVSPIPPPSESNAEKYINPKLFPFPGMVKLQEENMRSKGIGGFGISSSSPDISIQLSTNTDCGPQMGINTSLSSSQLQDRLIAERKLSHQASDSRLISKYLVAPGPLMSGSPASGPNIDYLRIPQAPLANGNGTHTLPRTREGVRKWLSAFRFGTAQSGQASNSSADLKSRMQAPAPKRPSLSEIRRDIENIGDWDEIEKAMATSTISHEKSTIRAQASTSTGMTTVAEPVSKSNSRDGEAPGESSTDDPFAAYQYTDSAPQSPRDADPYDVHERRHLSVPVSSSQDPSSATPDPASSEDSPGSGSSLDSIYLPEETSAQATELLQRLDEVLQSDYHNRLWTSALTSPPRRLLLSSPMLQVANCNTVKDRFLFLFTDILVIAKPMFIDRDSLTDTQKSYPLDRKFVIKNVVHLKDVRLNVGRDEDTNKPTSSLVSQRPEFIRNFVTEFMENPDDAVTRLVDLSDPKGCVTLGKLLVQLPEIDHAKLGDYLSRRTSKAILRAYLDAFGFATISIDMSLRIFLLSIHIPSGQGHANTLETLLDTFAGRWYEANAGIVAFDRDLAVRLVRAVVRLNEALHSATTHDFAGGLYTKPHLTAREFTEAFRRHDPRGLVSDSMLERIYTSVRREKLCQARNPTNGRAPIPVTLKRPIPSRITYRQQSDPIVLRIPHIDPSLTVHLYGQDLTFEPPVLTFTKSTETSFRVTGTTFGPKTMIMACAGANAPNYSGLPLSTTIAVERAFMRNTFQLAFADATGQKRKYMFSVDDPAIRIGWTGSLKRQIEAARAAAYSAAQQSVILPLRGPVGELIGGGGSVQMQVYRAAEALAFRVLQESLLATEPVSVNGTLRHGVVHERGLARYGSLGGSGVGNGKSVANCAGLQLGHRSTLGSPGISEIASGAGGLSSKEGYTRSQSRSQLYRYGAGRHEHEDLNGDDDRERGQEHHPSGLDLLEEELQLQGISSDSEARAWTRPELELVCQQNSSIALVLALLQAALPYDVSDEEQQQQLSNSFLQLAQLPTATPTVGQTVQVTRQLSQSSVYQI